MDWTIGAPYEGNGDGKGWVCTGGQDRTVKVEYRFDSWALGIV
jgi:hypothetical protein